MLEYFDTVTGAFLAGLVTSPHCAGMCGPLACALTPVRAQSGDARLLYLSCYQIARLASYTIIGALCGGLGSIISNSLKAPLATALPWALFLVFLAIGFRLDRFLPKPAWLGRAHVWINKHTRNKPLPLIGATLGFFTPLIPCGPLWFMFGLAALNADPLLGAEFGLAFGIGTLPLLWLAQSGFFFLQKRLGPKTLLAIQRVTAFAAAALILWRLMAGGGEWHCA
jgi:sulfite exporter TauE/SafE